MKVEIRPALPGELCPCGRQAVEVFMGGPYGPTGYCGIADGGLKTDPCPFCGESRDTHPPETSGRCPDYTLTGPAKA